MRGQDVALGWAPGRAPPPLSWPWGTRGASASLLPLPRQQGTCLSFPRLACPMPPIPHKPNSKRSWVARAEVRAAATGQRAREHCGELAGQVPLAQPPGRGGPRTPKAPGELTCSFLAGPCPIETSGTRSHFAVTDFPEESGWSAVVQQQDGNSLSVSLCSPTSACIGRYSLTLETSTGYQGTSYHIGHFVLLFNAWHPGEAFTFPRPGVPRQGEHKPPPSSAGADPRCPKPCPELRSKQKSTLCFHLHTVPTAGQGHEHCPPPQDTRSPFASTPNTQCPFQAAPTTQCPTGAHLCGAGAKP